MILYFPSAQYSGRCFKADETCLDIQPFVSVQTLGTNLCIKLDLTRDIFPLQQSHAWSSCLSEMAANS